MLLAASTAAIRALLSRRVFKASSGVHFLQLAQILNRIRLLLLGLLAAGFFHVNSTLLFAILGVAPSDRNNWPLVVVLLIVWSLSGAAFCLQSLCKSPRLFQLLGTVGGFVNGGILGLFIAGQLSQQQARWAMFGLCLGGVLAAVWAAHSYRPRATAGWFGVSALSLASGMCAYAIALYLGTWALTALSTQRYALSLGLVGPTLFFLWTTQRAVVFCYCKCVRQFKA